MPDLHTAAEAKAEKATALRSFPVNLIEIKRSISEILGHFGRGGIFHEYTMHDVSHIDDMLKTLEWIIPQYGVEALTPGDWITIVLSIYFHDMGLVVTDDEFKARESSGFRDFCQQNLFAGPNGKDYKAKVESLPSEEQDKFLYQEFVRFNHGRRVRNWIEGKNVDHLGISHAQVQEVQRLLSPLDSLYRRDLGIICESHNLDDLDDRGKYKIAQSYGDSDDETVNILFCAVILRSVDLLQITSGRTPAVSFSLINPKDPISQREWAKQRGVRRVKPRPARDKDGVVQETLPSDTIDVVAHFQSGIPFFGLTSYLRYAQSQLQMSVGLIEKSKQEDLRKYQFPWKFISNDLIEVEGCERRTFSFEIDQGKVLDLLTGHTLYNDSSVVIRELVQNAIDAVRLKAHELGQDSSTYGSIRITWDSKAKTLEVMDNGTGMTQAMIEKHFLRVGSSRYQDTKFKEKVTGFNSISRFGIGVLSSFMVADGVEVVTVHPEEEKARKITLQSVHGSYLVELKDKHLSADVSRIGPSGTSIKLNFRPSATETNVLRTLKQWILFPRCKVILIVDGDPPVNIGFSSPKDAVQMFLNASKTNPDERVEVRQKTIDDVTVAYAMRYSEHYRDWAFVTTDGSEENESGKDILPHATCVEGIAVEFETPGFYGPQLIAIANAVGAKAPKTNVARSALEATPERSTLYSAVYNALYGSISDECARLRAEESFSLTWITDQVPSMLAPLSMQPKNASLHDEALNKIPLFIIETDDSRKSISLSDLVDVGQFWTVDSQLTKSVEQVIREAKTEITAHDILKSGQGTTTSLPRGPILANAERAAAVRGLVRKYFEVSSMIVYVNERRVDLAWDKRIGRWADRTDFRRKIQQSSASPMYQQFLQQVGILGRPSFREVFVPIAEVSVSGLDTYTGVRTSSGIYLSPASAVSRVIANRVKVDNVELDHLISTALLLDAVEFGSQSAFLQGRGFRNAVEHFCRQSESRFPREWVSGNEELLSKIDTSSENARFFDPSSWSARFASDLN